MLKELLNQLTGQSNNTANEPKPAAEKKAPVAKNVVATETTGADQAQQGGETTRRTTRRTNSNRNTGETRRPSTRRTTNASGEGAKQSAPRRKNTILPMLRLMRKAQLNRLVPTTVRIIVLTLHVITIAMKKIPAIVPILMAVTHPTAMVMHMRIINIIRAKKISS